MSRTFGVVVSVQKGTITVTVAGSSVSVPGVQFMSSYTPAATDTVVIEFAGTDPVVTGAINPKSPQLPILVAVPWPWTGLTFPPNVFELNGQTLATMAADYPAMYARNGNSTTLPDWRGRTPIGYGQGTYSGATNHAIGAVLGEEAHTQSNGELAQHNHSDSGHSHSHAHGVNDPTHAHSQQVKSGTSGTGGLVDSANATSSGFLANVNANSTGIGIQSDNTSGNANIQNTGSSNPFNVMQPSVAVAWVVRAA
jgi:microcystin-dependent protein